MLILIAITFCVAFLIRFHAAQKIECHIIKKNYDYRLEKDIEFLRTIEKLSPKEIDNLLVECDNWLKDKKRSRIK